MNIDKEIKMAAKHLTAYLRNSSDLKTVLTHVNDCTIGEGSMDNIDWDALHIILQHKFDITYNSHTNVFYCIIGKHNHYDRDLVLWIENDYEAPGLYWYTAMDDLGTIKD